MKFVFKFGSIVSETHKTVKSAYDDDDATGWSSVYECHKFFREGREQVDDDQQSVCPKIIRTWWKW